MVEGKCQQYGQTNVGLQASLQRITLLNGVSLSKELGKQLDKLNMSRQGLRRGVFTGIHAVKSACAGQIKVFPLVNYSNVNSTCDIQFLFYLYHCIFKYISIFHKQITHS